MKTLYINILLTILGLTNTINAQYPDFLWAVQMGETSDDFGNSIAVDAKGNVYTTGSFRDTVDFNPGTETYYLSSKGGTDIFISKLDPFGNLIWAKRMGGIKDDGGSSIAVDSDGYIYTTGSFQDEADFNPDSLGIYNLTSKGGYDIFISKLDTDGSFMWAKQIGGVGADAGYEIAVDIRGSVYTTGIFQLTVDFNPDDSGPYNLSSAGGNDIFVSKLDTSGNFVWAKRFGGMSEDSGNSIVVDRYENIYITGWFVETADFGTCILTSTNSRDSYVCSLDINGSCLWVKQISGDGNQESNSIAIDYIGNIFTTGRFQFNTLIDGKQVGLYTTGNYDIFISKLDATGTHTWAKQMTGPGLDVSSSIVVDANGNVYTTGAFYEKVDFYPGAGTYFLQADTSLSFNAPDVFISKLDPSGIFRWAIKMGGPGNDFGASMAVDSNGSVYLAGSFTSNANFDPNGGTYNLNSVGGYDIFVEKICQIITPTIDVNGKTTFCQGDSVELIANDNIANKADSYLWSNGATTQKITVDSSGDYSVTVAYASGCSAYSSVITVTVIPLPIVDLGPDTITIQQGQQISLDASSSDTSLTYLWSTGVSTPKINVDSMGTYTVTVTKASCTVTDSVVIFVVTSTNDKENNLKISVSPNPANQLINIKCESESITSIQLIDNLGRLLLEDNSFTPNGVTQTLFLDKIPAGTYQLIITGEDFSKTISIIKIDL